MIDALRKALSARKHAGISRSVSLPRLMRQSLPYVTSVSGKALPPLTVYWAVNNICNLKCKMCDVGTSCEGSNFYKTLRIDRSPHQIDLQRFKDVTDEIKKYRPMYCINSTEPLLYEHLAEAIAYSRASGLEVAVTTNGYVLFEKAEELAQAGVTRLNVSIDGPPELHNLIRGRGDAFQRAAQGIVNFETSARRACYRPEIVVNYTITNMNASSLEMFYDAIAGYPIDCINFNYMNYVNEEMAEAHNAFRGDVYRATVTCLSDEVRPELVDVNDLADQMESLQSKGDSRVQFFPFYTAEELKRYFQRSTEFMGSVRCMGSWIVAQILASGEVMPYTRCYCVSWGNINQESFLDIWNGKRARAWRKDIRGNGRFPACSRCDMVY